MTNKKAEKMTNVVTNITMENASEKYANKDFSNVIAVLEKMYAITNEHFKNTIGEITLPVFLTVASKGKRSVYGWCSTKPFYTDVDGANVAYEINIASETLGRHIGDTYVTLVHEMVHLINIQHGIKDTSGTSGRHNQKFKDACDKVGLSCKKETGENARVGFSTWEDIDTCRADLQEVFAKIQEECDTSVLAVNRIETVKGKIRAKKASTNLHKYECPHCCAIARAKADASLICGQCFEETKDIVFMNECLD